MFHVLICRMWRRERVWRCVCQVETCTFFDLDESDVNGCESACSGNDRVDCDAVDNDCDGEVDEGFDLQSDANHCGTCNTACAGLPNTSAIGVCDLSSQRVAMLGFII